MSRCCSTSPTTLLLESISVSRAAVWSMALQHKAAARILGTISVPRAAAWSPGPPTAQKHAMNRHCSTSLTARMLCTISVPRATQWSLAQPTPTIRACSQDERGHLVVRSIQTTLSTFTHGSWSPQPAPASLRGCLVQSRFPGRRSGRWHRRHPAIRACSQEELGHLAMRPIQVTSSTCTHDCWSVQPGWTEVGHEAYPGGGFYLHSQLLERASKNNEGAWS